MDEEKASVEDLLKRGEELLQQTSDEGQREELRLLLLRLQSQYSAHRVSYDKNISSFKPASHMLFAFCALPQSAQCVRVSVHLL